MSLPSLKNSHRVLSPSTLLYSALTTRRKNGEREDPGQRLGGRDGRVQVESQTCLCRRSLLDKNVFLAWRIWGSITIRDYCFWGPHVKKQKETTFIYLAIKN